MTRKEAFAIFAEYEFNYKPNSSGAFSLVPKDVVEAQLILENFGVDVMGLRKAVNPGRVEMAETLSEMGLVTPEEKQEVIENGYIFGYDPISGVETVISLDSSAEIVIEGNNLTIENYESSVVGLEVKGESLKKAPTKKKGKK